MKQQQRQGHAPPAWMLASRECGTTSPWSGLPAGPVDIMALPLCESAIPSLCVFEYVCHDVQCVKQIFDLSSPEFNSRPVGRGLQRDAPSAAGGPKFSQWLVTL